MTQWSPVWQIKINSVEYTTTTLSNLTISSGRTNIYEQAQAGYANVTLINLNQASVPIQINDSISIQVKDTSGTFVPIFGGSVVDVGIEVSEAGSSAYTQSVSIIALGALARLPKALTDGVLSQGLRRQSNRDNPSRSIIRSMAERSSGDLHGRLMMRPLHGQQPRILVMVKSTLREIMN
jgi:hypothetical protein